MAEHKTVIFPDYFSEMDRQFYEMFNHYVEVLSKRDPELEGESVELHNQLMEMICLDQVSPACVVYTFTQMLTQYPTLKHFFISIIGDVVSFRQLNGQYPYPELLWLMIRSNILLEVESIYDIMRDLSHFGQPDIIRAYLTYLLMIEPTSKQRDIVRSFYYVGQTVESLKAVRQIVPLDEDHLELYGLIYSDAMSLVYSPRAEILSDDDKAYLNDFFTRGLALPHSWINESCQKGLTKLNALVS